MQTATLITAFILGAPALKDPPKKEVNLVGEWVVESQTSGGRAVQLTFERLYIFSADGKWTLTTGKAKTRRLTRVYTLDNSRAPAQIDMKISAAAAVPTYIGIAKMDGDRLILCYARGRDERPKRFESPEGTTVILVVLKRVKKE